MSSVTHRQLVGCQTSRRPNCNFLESPNCVTLRRQPSPKGSESSGKRLVFPHDDAKGSILSLFGSCR